MKVRTADQREVAKLVTLTSREVSAALESMFEGRHQFCLQGTSLKAQPIDALRWFTELIPGSSKTMLIRNIMVNALSDSESIQGASAVVCAAALSSLLRSPHIGGLDLLKRAQEDIRLISQLSRRSTSSNLFSIIECLDNDPTSSKATIAALKKCSPSASISVIKEGQQSLVRNTRGYKFPSTCPELFVSSSGARGDISLEGARVFVIDGTIEEMSEIDGVVAKSYESKTPLLIVARGFSSDVINTLGINFLHGHLKVVPVVVSYDVLGANLINDICVVCSSDLVSSFKGDLISTKKWEEIRAVDSVKVHTDRGAMTIFSRSGKQRVQTHKISLGKKITQASNSLETSVLEKRLSCLSGDGVEIVLGSDLQERRGIYADRIGSHVRNFRSGAKWGTIDLKDAAAASQLSGPVRDSIKMLRYVSPEFASSSLIIGIRSAVSCAKSLRSLGGIICSDQ